jgi:hypothetical protein
LLLYNRLERDIVQQRERAGVSEEPAALPVPDQDELRRRLQPFEDLAAALRTYRQRSERLTPSPWEDRVWLIRESSETQDVLDIVADRLLDWAIQRIRDPREKPPAVVLHRVASNPEIQALFRAAQLLPIGDSIPTAPDVALWRHMRESRPCAGTQASLITSSPIRS